LTLLLLLSHDDDDSDGKRNDERFFLDFWTIPQPTFSYLFTGLPRNETGRVRAVLLNTIQVNDNETPKSRQKAKTQVSSPPELYRPPPPRQTAYIGLAYTCRAWCDERPLVTPQ